MIHVSSANPGCVVFLVDRSASMGRSGSRGETLAMMAASLVNEALATMIVRSHKDISRPRNYFHVGVYGYGIVPETGRQGVSSLLGKGVGPGPIYGVQQLCMNPLRVEDRRREVPDGAGGVVQEWVKFPVWVEPAYGCQTLVCRAIADVGKHLLAWTADHLDSPPPVVVNVTDGLVGGDSFEGADVSEWCSRLGRISTHRGVVKAFDAVLSTESHVVTLRPATTVALADPGWTITELAGLLDYARISAWDVDIHTWASEVMAPNNRTSSVPEPPCEADMSDRVRDS